MKRRMNKLIALIILLSPLSVYSANNVINTKTENTISQNSRTYSTRVGSAKNWNLSDTEWANYQTLMQGQAGYYYSQLTPPEVLGYYANNDIERLYYAEIYAKLEHEKIERELKFDKAFHEAAVRLYANEPIIKPFDVSPYTPIPKTIYEHNNALQSGDHLVLFVDVKQNQDADTLKSLISQIKSNAGVTLDIYCVNATDDFVIREWAESNKIPIDLVSESRITLNNDSGKFKKTGLSHLPSLMAIHDGKSKLVNMGDF